MRDNELIRLHFEYNFHDYSVKEVKVIYKIVRETEKCYVIKIGRKDVFVLKYPNGKRFAYLKEEDAKKNLYLRTKRRFDLLASQLEFVRKCVNYIEKQ